MKKSTNKPSKLSRFEKRVEERHKRQEAEYGRDEFLFGAAEDDEEADVEFDDEATSEWDATDVEDDVVDTPASERDAAEVEADVEDAATSGWNAAEVESAEECTPRVGENTEMIAAEIVEAEMASLAAEMSAEITDEPSDHEHGDDTADDAGNTMPDAEVDADAATSDEPHEIGSETMNISAAILAETERALAEESVINGAGSHDSHGAVDDRYDDESDVDDPDIEDSYKAYREMESYEDEEPVDEDEDFDFYSMSETAELEAAAVAEELYHRQDRSRTPKPKVHKESAKHARSSKADAKSAARNAKNAAKDAKYAKANAKYAKSAAKSAKSARSYEKKADAYEKKARAYEKSASNKERERGRDRDRDRDRDRRRRGGFFGGIADFFSNMTMSDRLIVVTGVCVLITAIVTGVIFANTQTIRKQVASFDTVGASTDGIYVIGESGLNAVVAARAGYSAVQEEVEDVVEEVEEPEEIVIEDKTVTIVMKVSSVQSDLKIKFANKATDKLISGIPFEVTVTADSGKEYNWTDENKDGLMYHTEVPNGTYNVSMKPLEGPEYEDYVMPDDVKGVKVTDTIAYKKIDVADEVKTEAEVNVAQEDTAVQDTAIESALKDTVEWVESTKTLITEGDGQYTQIKKEDIDTSNKTSMNRSVPGLNQIVATSTFRYMAYSGTGPDNPSQDTSGDPTSSSPDISTPTTPDTSTPTTPVQVSISVSPNLTLKVGEDGIMTATVTGADDKSVTWSSSDSSVATVSGGTVHAISAGTAVITATSNADSSISGSCSVTVSESAPVMDVSISVSSSSLSLEIGQSGSIDASVTGSSDTSVTWSSSNSSVATVSNGTVTAVAAGTAVIKATSNADTSKTASCTVSVTEPKAVAATVLSVSLDKPTLAMKTGGTEVISATVRMSDNTVNSNVQWKSSDNSIATVSGGTITAQKAGKATITATSTVDTTKSASCTVTVTLSDQKTVSISVAPATVSVAVGSTAKVTATVSGASDPTVNWASQDTGIATVDKDGNIKGVKEGITTVTAALKEDPTKTASISVTVTRNESSKIPLKDKNGNLVYIKDKDGNYVQATLDDYNSATEFYVSGKYKYTGWQTIDGSTYFFDKDGNYVTGEQIIQGAKYTFSSDGHLQAGSGTMGIDVSKWNGNIDWTAVRNSGVSYVIIRCGYRGSTTGALIEDPKFRSNIQGAKAAGLSVGAYFFTQATNEVEAVEEASMAIGLCSGYGLSLPIFLDVEHSGGRGDSIDAGTRTAVCKAFCNTVRNSGFGAGIYANKVWLTSYMNASQLTGYKIWLAQYAATPTYTATRYDYWQYTSKGSVAGINGNVDMNIRY